MEKLIGILLPALIDTINSKIEDSRARFWISVIVCGMVAFGLDWIIGKAMTPEIVATDIMTMFGIASISYKALWENSEVRSDLRLNAKTNGTDRS